MRYAGITYESASDEQPLMMNWIEDGGTFPRTCHRGAVPRSYRDPRPLQNAPPSSNILAFLVVSEAPDEEARSLVGHGPLSIIALSLRGARCYRKMKSPAPKLGIAAETTVKAPDPPLYL